MGESNPYLYRSAGILLIDGGVIIRAYPEEDDRTKIEVAPSIVIGAIIRDNDTDRWRYDDDMRSFLGIVDNPDFATDVEAGNQLERSIPDLAQVLAKVRAMLRSRDWE